MNQLKIIPEGTSKNGCTKNGCTVLVYVAGAALAVAGILAWKSYRNTTNERQSDIDTRMESYFRGEGTFR